MEQIKKCKFCESNAFRYYCEQTDKNFGIPGKFSLEKCYSCNIM